MGQKRHNTGFRCLRCGCDVEPVADGSYRNHCPRCLYSLHLDVLPGDRASECGGLMAPVGLKWAGGKGWQLVHRCEACGVVRHNRVAGGHRQPDDGDALTGVAMTGAPPDTV